MVLLGLIRLMIVILPINGLLVLTLVFVTTSPALVYVTVDSVGMHVSEVSCF